jgi:hypothetical protein
MWNFWHGKYSIQQWNVTINFRLPFTCRIFLSNLQLKSWLLGIYMIMNGNSDTSFAVSSCYFLAQLLLIEHCDILDASLSVSSVVSSSFSCFNWLGLIHVMNRPINFVSDAKRTETKWHYFFESLSFKLVISLCLSLINWQANLYSSLPWLNFFWVCCSICYLPALCLHYSP